MKSNLERYNRAVNETRSMIQRHRKKAPWAILEAEKTVRAELREAKIRKIPPEELKRLMETENLNWNRVDIVFNEDS